MSLLLDGIAVTGDDDPWVVASNLHVPGRGWIGAGRLWGRLVGLAQGEPPGDDCGHSKEQGGEPAATLDQAWPMSCREPSVWLLLPGQRHGRGEVRAVRETVGTIAAVDSGGCP